MRSPVQIEAARQNGAKSKEPVTAEGRARSSQNAAKHGLSGHKLMVVEGESPEEWQALVEDCVGEFSPESNMEWELVVEIAAARWRLRRSKFVETAMIDMEIGKQRTQLDDTYAAPDHPLSHATAMMALGSNMTLLDRYETRATRAYDRAVRNFDSLRARRKSAAAEKSFLPNEPERRRQH